MSCIPCSLPCSHLASLPHLCPASPSYILHPAALVPARCSSNIPHPLPHPHPAPVIPHPSFLPCIHHTSPIPSTSPSCIPSPILTPIPQPPVPAISHPPTPLPAMPTLWSPFLGHFRAPGKIPPYPKVLILDFPLISAGGNQGRQQVTTHPSCSSFTASAGDATAHIQLLFSLPGCSGWEGKLPANPSDVRQKIRVLNSAWGRRCEMNFAVPG